MTMPETQEQWYNRQAIKHLAQHIPFETDIASKAEQIEMLRGLVTVSYTHLTLPTNREV